MNDDIKKMSQDIQNRVSQMAYLLWETAGRQQGMAMEYWLAAEKEIMATAQKTAEKMIPQEQAAPAKTATPKPAAKTTARKTTRRKKTTS